MSLASQETDVYTPSDHITFGIWIWLYLCQGWTFENILKLQKHNIAPPIITDFIQG